MMSTTKAIVFGTSGHRGIIGKDFSFHHVKAITQAIAEYVKTEPAPWRLVVGCDPREGNSLLRERGSFTECVTETLLQNGIDVDFLDRYSPTPLVSWYIRFKSCSGGIILTASHNPPEYNGLKFNPANGAPAPAEMTKHIEEQANRYYFEGKENDSVFFRGTLRLINAHQDFCQWLIDHTHKLIPFNSQRLAAFRVLVDVKHGTAGKIWDTVFSRLAIRHADILHPEPRSDFGGLDTNPLKAENISVMTRDILAKKGDLAIVNDPDADRHLILDETGSLLMPEETCAILFDFLRKQGAPLLGMATTVASSRLIKSVTSQTGVAFYETPVGFKYFAPFFEKAEKQNKIALGVESSGGITLSSHTFEKCGFLPPLLLMAILSNTDKSLSVIRNQIRKMYGKSVFYEAEARFDFERRDKIINRFNTPDKNKLETHFGRPIHTCVITDGLKIIFKHEDWCLIRLSGTEPVARLYAETDNKGEAKRLVEGLKQLLR